MIKMVKDAEKKVNEESNKSDESSKLSFYSILILCKSIAHFQKLLLQRPENEVKLDQIFFIALHDSGTEGTKTLANFNLKKSVLPASGRLLKDRYESYVSGYELCSTGPYENTHVRFRISTMTTVSSQLDLPGLSCAGPYKTEVTRRFKDFEFLVRMLLESAPGCIIPPLPVKGFALNSISDDIALQRGRELTYFLSMLTSHPILGQTFVLKVFLESSIDGFKAYREICIPKPIVAATTEMCNKAVIAAENGLKEMSRQLGSMFGFVGKKVLQAAEEHGQALAPTVYDTNAAADETSSSSLLSANARSALIASTASLPQHEREELLNLGTRLENALHSSDACQMLLDQDSRLAYSLSQLGSSFMALSAEATDPCLDVQLAIAGEAMERISTAHNSAIDIQRQICATPYSFLGRYSSSLQSAVDTYVAAKTANEGAVRAFDIKQRELNRAQQRYNSDSIEVYRAQEDATIADRKATATSENAQTACAHLKNDQSEVDTYRLKNLTGIISSFVEARSEVSREQAEMYEALRDRLLETHFSLDDLLMQPETAATREESGVQSDLQRAIEASLSSAEIRVVEDPVEQAALETYDEESSIPVAFNPDDPLS